MAISGQDEKQRQIDESNKREEEMKRYAAMDAHYAEYYKKHLAQTEHVEVSFGRPEPGNAIVDANEPAIGFASPRKGQMPQPGWYPVYLGKNKVEAPYKLYVDASGNVRPVPPSRGGYSRAIDFVAGEMLHDTVLLTVAAHPNHPTIEGKRLKEWLEDSIRKGVAARLSDSSNEFLAQNQEMSESRSLVESFTSGINELIGRGVIPPMTFGDEIRMLEKLSYYTAAESKVDRANGWITDGLREATSRSTALNTSWNATKTSLETFKTQIDTLNNEIEAAKTALKKLEADANTPQADLDTAKKTLDDLEKRAKNENPDVSEKIADAIEKTIRELDAGIDKIDNIQAKLDDLEKAEKFILDNPDNLAWANDKKSPTGGPIKSSQDAIDFIKNKSDRQLGVNKTNLLTALKTEQEKLTTVKQELAEKMRDLPAAVPTARLDELNKELKKLDSVLGKTSADQGTLAKKREELKQWHDMDRKVAVTNAAGAPAKPPQRRM